MDDLKTLLGARCTRLGDDAKYGSHGTVEMYREGVKWAIEKKLAGELPKDGRLASKTLKAVGVNVSHATLNNRVNKQDGDAPTGNGTDAPTGNVATPQKPGKGTRIPRRYELALVEFVQKLRFLKLKAGKSILVGAANFLIRGTDLELAFKDRQVNYSWYYSFRKRWGIKLKSQTGLEMDRAKWTTAEHLAAGYEVVMDAMLKCGIAVKNEDFNPDLPYDTMFYVTDPDMLFEWDQTSFTLDQTEDGKAPTEKSMVVDANDDGECVAVKSAVKWTITGGSFMTGDSLPGCACRHRQVSSSRS